MRLSLVLACFVVVPVAPSASASAQDAVAPPAQDVAPPPDGATAPPAPAAVAAEAPAPSTAGQLQNGFVLDVHLGTHLAAIGGFGGAAVTLGTLDGGFFAGWKLDRLMLGLGIDFSRAHQTRGTPGSDSSTTPVVVMPGVRYTFVRSDDGRVDLYGELDLGIGHAFNEVGDPNNVVLRYVVGPGVRFWIHPQFALAALTGLDGTFVWTNGPWGMNDVHAVFATVALLGVF